MVYRITYLFHGHGARATRACEQRHKLVTLQWSGLWGRYLTPETVFRDRGDESRS